MIDIRKLEEEITGMEKNTISDGTTIFIDHLIINFDKGKLDIKPKYQRVFRWTKEQKSKFIESLLLGIPLPSIFIAEDKEGNWELVDGLQRISTILEFSKNKKFLDTIYHRNDETILDGLEAGQYLKELEGITWEKLPIKYRNRIEDTQIYVSKIKNTGDIKAKFELFQRLNTGGTKLSNQEVRNCLLVDKKEEIYDKILKISNNSKFLKLIDNVKKDKVIAEENMELVIRTLASQNINISSNIKIEKLLDEFMYKIFDFKQELFLKELNLEKDFESFLQMINLISELDDKAFNNILDGERKNHFIYPLYDLISSGISFNIKEGNIDISSDEHKDKIKHKLREIQEEKEYKNGVKGGSSQSRLKFSNNYGRKYFNLSK